MGVGGAQRDLEKNEMERIEGQRKVKSSNVLLLQTRGIHGNLVRAESFHTITGCQSEMERSSSRDLMSYILNFVMQPRR